jgi:aspartate dehydrogenase
MGATVTRITPDTAPALRVGLIGHGAIGHVVADALRAGTVEGCTLAAVLDPFADDVAEGVADIDALIDASDVVVEAAGHAALSEHGPAVRAAGLDLYVVSVGALVDDDLRARLLGPGPGRVLLCSGAVGGFDALRAAHRLSPLRSVTLTTTKPAIVLIEPSWMDPALVARLERQDDHIEVFHGSAREAAGRFPRSVNVSATLALASLGLDDTKVRVVADPHAEGVEHVIEAHGDAGSYVFAFRNHSSPDNPRTSAITPYAVLRALADRSATVVVGG